MMKNIIVIGAGAMGLASAYKLLKEGHQVTIVEAIDVIGGMSSHFDFNGLDIEKFYHFICGPDETYFNVLKDLGISDKLRWSNTKMSYFYNGKMYRWGDPVSLLMFPKLDLITKFRYGLHALTTTKISNWNKLDEVNAVSWIKKWIGEKGYDVLWRKLFELKFYEYTNNMSASWIGTRIKRVGLSRKNMFTEQMGYLEGGSNTLFKALEKEIIRLGGTIKLNTKVQEVLTSGSSKKVITEKNEILESDVVISTIPLPYISSIFLDLPEEIIKKYNSVKNIPVTCVIAKMNRPLTDNFWLNINDSRMQIPGIIEYTNLNRDLDDNIVYVPYYMPRNHPDFYKDDDFFQTQVINYCKLINSEIRDDNFKDMKVFRYEYAQPICPPEYLKGLPEINPGVEGVFIADTSSYYPEDRSISESMRIGFEIANSIK
jgi:protoporphyrinogen oxidase